MKLTDEQVEIIAAEYLKEIKTHYYGTAEQVVRMMFTVADDLIGIDAICGHVDGSPFKYEDEP